MTDQEEVIENIKKVLKIKDVVLGGINQDGDFVTFIDSEIDDIDLVYMIQTFSERRLADLKNG